VLVDAEEVVRIVLPLYRLQPVVLLRAVGGSDPVLPLVAEEVDVHRRVPRLERGPEVPHPLALGVEAFARRRTGADVVGEARVAAAEGGGVLPGPRDCAAHLP